MWIGILEPTTWCRIWCILPCIPLSLVCAWCPPISVGTGSNHQWLGNIDRSSFILEEQVNKKNAFDFVGKGELVPEITRLADYGGRFTNLLWRPEDVGAVPPEYRSSTYQWLPANVAFREDGSAEFTSNINNLHPGKYPAIYKAIEHAIDTAIPAWDQCLKEDIKFDESVTAGRNESRFEFISEAE